VVYPREDLVNKDGQPLSDEEWANTLMLMEAGYDPTDPELQGKQLGELFPQIRARGIYTN